MKVFVDTSAFVALENRRDSEHDRALRAYRKMLKASEALVTTDYVFDEAVTVLKMRAGNAVAVAWGRRMLASRLIEMRFVDRSVLDAALEILETSADQRFSFTDCTSFALMRSLDIGSAFAFDDDFARFGFSSIPGR